MRAASEAICAPLAVEDYGVQPMADASPPKWHLAHTTWFFETFLLRPLQAGYRPFHGQFETLFNSYYNGVGEPFPRAERGRLSRPTVAEVYDYRAAVDDAMAQLLSSTGEPELVAGRVELGLHHEQQHQELMFMDIKANLGTNPLYPPYRTGNSASVLAQTPVRTPQDFGGPGFQAFDGGISAIGATAGFAFDNERPRHQVLVHPFELAERLVTNADYLAFMEAGGYDSPELWLADGWAALQSARQQGRLAAPRYWRTVDGGWSEYRLDGLAELDLNRPVTHVSYYEADAFARWAGCRLPTEFEWELAAALVLEEQGDAMASGHFVDDGELHPRAARGAGLTQLFGDCWEWTSSDYGPYPGFEPLGGTLGEYNGKFMSGQRVLRGGSCVTPLDHMRVSYRNFFYPGDCWQFSGIRLARTIAS